MSWVWIVRIAVAAVLLLIEGIRDLKTKEIDMVVPVFSAVAAVILAFVGKDPGVISMLFGIAEGIVLIVLSFLTKGGIGQGDGIILCVTGLMFGWKANLIMFFWGCLICAVTSLILMILKKADRKTGIPFIPFLFPALFITVLPNGLIRI